MAESCTCSKCGKTMDEKNFYTYKDGRKTELCKKCLTMHIDNFDESTFLWLLEQMDVPYIPEEWNVLRDRAYAKDPYNMNGMSVFGKYLSKMKLKQWKQFGWADTEKLQAQNEEKRKAAIETQKRFEEDIKKQYENGEITEAQYKTLTSVPAQHENENGRPVPPPQTDFGKAFYDENNFMLEEELADPAAELTAEDKLYLAMKWGRLYKPNEWVELEKNYNEMMESFDIQDADTINTLKLICKTNLKLNQAIDCGDLDGYQKLSRVYESLRKSAKFTAAQNKESKGDFVDCIGTMVAYCEKEGGQIPKFEIKADLDIIDTIIKDNKEYTKSLIYQDTALAKQIEDYLKKKEISEEMKKDKEQAKRNNEEGYILTDKDIEDNLKRIEEEKQQDTQEQYERNDEE
jgi:hypothetical protein